MLITDENVHTIEEGDEVIFAKNSDCAFKENKVYTIYENDCDGGMCPLSVIEWNNQTDWLYHNKTDFGDREIQELYKIIKE
jgi:hypothetical protein